jgi:hypothetical protein
MVLPTVNVRPCNLIAHIPQIHTGATFPAVPWDLNASSWQVGTESMSVELSYDALLTHIQ